MFVFRAKITEISGEYQFAKPAVACSALKVNKLLQYLCGHDLSRSRFSNFSKLTARSLILTSNTNTLNTVCVVVVVGLLFVILHYKQQLVAVDLSNYFNTY